AGEHGIAIACSYSRRGRRFTAEFGAPCLGLGWRAIVNDDTVAAADFEVTGHRIAHNAKTEPRHVRHLANFLQSVLDKAERTAPLIHGLRRSFTAAKRTSREQWATGSRQTRHSILIGSVRRPSEACADLHVDIDTRARLFDVDFAVVRIFDRGTPVTVTVAHVIILIDFFGRTDGIVAVSIATVIFGVAAVILAVQVGSVGNRRCRAGEDRRRGKGGYQWQTEHEISP